MLFRNFAEAEEMLTQALTKTEEHFGVLIQILIDF